MMVRSRDDIYRMADLKGKKIGLSRSQNKIKTDWWGIQEEQGIELMLRINGMIRNDVQIVGNLLGRTIRKIVFTIIFRP